MTGEMGRVITPGTGAEFTVTASRKMIDKGRMRNRLKSMTPIHANRMMG